MASATVNMPEAMAGARVLGQMVAAHRRERGLTAAELAELVGVSVPTLRKVERGDPTVALGTALHAAVIVGVQLFGAEGRELAELVARGEQELALLPARVRAGRVEIDNDF